MSCFHTRKIGIQLCVCKRGYTLIAIIGFPVVSSSEFDLFCS